MNATGGDKYLGVNVSQQKRAELDKNASICFDFYRGCCKRGKNCLLGHRKASADDKARINKISPQGAPAQQQSQQPPQQQRAAPAQQAPRSILKLCKFVAECKKCPKGKQCPYQHDAKQYPPSAAAKARVKAARAKAKATPKADPSKPCGAAPVASATLSYADGTQETLTIEKED